MTRHKVSMIGVYIQIEASIRGGQIAGGMAQRAIFVAVSGVLLMI